MRSTLRVPTAMCGRCSDSSGVGLTRPDAPANGAWVLERRCRLEGRRRCLARHRRWRRRYRSNRSSEARSAAAELQHPARTLGDILATVDQVVGRGVAVDEAIRLLSSRENLDRLEQQLDATRADDEVRSSAHGYAAAETDWESLDAALAWAADLRPSWILRLTTRSPRVCFRARFLPRSSMSHCRNGCLRETRFAATSRRTARGAAAGLHDDRRGRARTSRCPARNAPGYRGVVRVLTSQRSRLLELGVVEPLEFCESRSLDAELVPHVVERAVLERWADEVMASDKARISTGPGRGAFVDRG